MAADQILSPHAATQRRQPIYRYGVRAWWVRLKLLFVYAIAALLLLVMASSWEIYLEEGSIETLNPVFRSLLLFGMWLIAVVTAWRRGNTRVSFMAYLPDQNAIEVRTLNLLTRYVSLDVIRRVEYQYSSLVGSAGRPPKVVIYPRDTIPLEVDTACAWIDTPLFETLFPRHVGPVSPVDGVAPLS